MVTRVTEHPAAVATYAVHIDGTAFPHLIRSAEATVGGHGSSESVEDKLFEQIWTRLPFPHSRSATTKELLSGYEASFQLLQNFHSEFAQMLARMVQLNFSARHTGVKEQVRFDAELKRRLDELLRYANLQPPKADSVVDAHLLAKPNEEIQRTLTRSLRLAATSFSRQVMRSFDRMVDRDVTGVIEWTAGDVCKLHFFSELLTQSFNADSRTTRTSENSRRIKTQIIERKSGVNESVRTRHQHCLIDARQSAISDPSLVIPDAYREFVLTLPAWLRPLLRIVTGTQVREDIIEQVKIRKKWQKERVVSTNVRQKERVVSSNLLLQYDPAITLGHYVLTGWGQSAVDDELARHTRIATESKFEQAAGIRRLAVNLLAAFAILFQFAGLLFTVSGVTRSVGFLLLGLAMTSIGLALAVGSLVIAYTDQRKAWTHSSIRRESARIGSWAALLLATHLFVSAWLLGNWVLGVVALAALIAGYGMRYFRVVTSQ